MRVLIVALAMLSLAEEAAAGDFLRGSYNWGGIYGGVQAGYAVGGVDFTSATELGPFEGTLLDTVSTSTALAKQTVSSASYGGFVGYNSVWDDVVLGVEANYSRRSLSASSSNTINGSFLSADQFLFSNANVVGTDSVRITDYGTLRLRGGWAVGQFLPYAMAGVAVGRADITLSAMRNPAVGVDVSGAGRPNVVSAPLTITETHGGVFAYGWTAGLGIDICLLSNVFLRGEWEWTQFAPLQGRAIFVDTVRTALGVKF